MGDETAKDFRNLAGEALTVNGASGGGQVWMLSLY
jgi:hypothetical protein